MAAFILFFESRQARYIYFYSSYGRVYQRNRVDNYLDADSKDYGGKSGSGELPELLKHLYETALHVNWVSVGLGVGALAILIISKK